jgi:hypothetical protein
METKAKTTLKRITAEHSDLSSAVARPDSEVVIVVVVIVEPGVDSARQFRLGAAVMDLVAAKLGEYCAWTTRPSKGSGKV